jgi:lipopolysaccharide export system permease protein
MTGVLTRYVSRLLLERFAAILVGLAALLILLDFLEDGDQVLAGGGGTALPILKYVGLRLPETLSLLIPIAALLASLLTVSELTRYWELAVILWAGVSPLRLVLMALPVALLIAAAQFVIQDQAVPPATRELQRWGVGDVKQPYDPQAFAWIKIGNDIVRYRLVAGDAPRLAEITIYQRDAAGALHEAISAERAAYESGSWMLYGIRRSTGEQRVAEQLDRLSWPAGPPPSFLAMVSTPLDTRSFAELVRGEHTELGDYPLYMYRLALNERLMHPVMTVLLVILALALARPVPQRARIGTSFVKGAALGLLGWMSGNLLASVGGLGLLPPLIASWAPAALVMTIAAFAAVSGIATAVRLRS